MILHTSRYHNKALADDPGLKVGITVGNPRGALPYVIVDRVRRLAPHPSTLHMEDADAFEVLYRRKLDGYGPDAIRQRLEGICRRYANDRLILLCFEDLAKPGLWCHRSMFARWWQDNTDEVVAELDAPPAPPRDPRPVSRQRNFVF